MKKDIFNGKIKKEYISYLVTSYIVVSVLFLPLAGFFLFFFIHAHNIGKIIYGLLFLASLYLAVINPLLTFYIIRRYPKHPVLRKLLINSEYYFIGNNDRKSSGRRCDKTKFNLITYLVDKKSIKKIEWHYSIYTSLIDISVRRNNKKRRFWYEIDQIKKIEDVVSVANEYAELKWNKKDDKLVSFNVIDTLNDQVVFTGIFI